MLGLVVGGRAPSYQGCSEGLHALAREVAEESARTEWRQLGARGEHGALGIFVHDVHRRSAGPPWGSVFWRSWARVIRGRLPAIGRPNAEILHHGPLPAYARGQAAVGGAEPWPRVHPGVLRGDWGARRGGPVSGARPAGGRGLAGSPGRGYICQALDFRLHLCVVGSAHVVRWK